MTYRPSESVEIEVTPEMVEAGRFELANYDPEFDTGTAFVIAVYRAMEASRSQHTPR